MSNRRELRRTAKISYVAMIDTAKLPSGCAWSGCTCSTLNPDNDGWSKLILYRGTTRFNFMDIAPHTMDRDAVL